MANIFQGTGLSLTEEISSSVSKKVSRIQFYGTRGNFSFESSISLGILSFLAENAKYFLHKQKF